MRISPDTPPDGDFARYIENLTRTPASQAPPPPSPGAPAPSARPAGRSVKAPVAGRTPVGAPLPPPAASSAPVGLNGLEAATGLFKTVGRAVAALFAVWFGLGLLGNLFPVLHKLIAPAVLVGIVWLYFAVKKQLTPDVLAGWRAQIERAAREAQRRP